jgi:hypothetical protein
MPRVELSWTCFVALDRYTARERAALLGRDASLFCVDWEEGWAVVELDAEHEGGVIPRIHAALKPVAVGQGAVWPRVGPG